MKHVINRLSFIILTAAVSCAAAAFVWAQAATNVPNATSEKQDTGQSQATVVVSEQPALPQRPLVAPGSPWPYHSDSPLIKANPSNLLAPPRTPIKAAAKDPPAAQLAPALPFIPAAPTGPGTASNPSAALPEPITWHMTTIPLQHLRAVDAGKRVRESYPEVRVTTVEFPAQSLVVRATTEDQLVEVYRYLQGIDSPSKPIPPTKPSEPPPPAVPEGAKVIDSAMLPLPKEPATEQDAEQITAISLHHLSGDEAAKQLRLLFPEVKVASTRSPTESVIIRSPSERQRMEMEAILRRIDIAPSKSAGHVEVSPTEASAAKQQPDGAATTKVFRLKHADPASVALVVGQLFPKLQVAADGSSRTLITRGGQTDLLDLQAIFEAIDVPPAPPQSANSFMPPGASSRNVAPGGLAALREQYRSREQQAQQLANQARGGAKQPVQDAIGMEGGVVRGWAKDGAGPPVTPELREQVTKAFEARQQLLRVELEQFRQRLARIEQTLEVRERLKQTIIDQRIKELVNPALEWEPSTETPGNEPEPTASIARPSPVDASRPGVIVDPNRVQRDPTGSIDELRRQVKFSIDRVQTDASALNDAIAAAKALEEAEAMLMSQPRNIARASAQEFGMGALTPFLERRERWQQIQKHADELYQRDLISYEASAEAHSRLQRTIAQLRRAQDNRAEQIKVLTRTVSDLNEQLNLLKTTPKNPAGPLADKEKNEISLLESSVKQWEFLLAVLRLNPVPRGSDRELDAGVAGLDPTNDAEALWNALGVRLIPDDATAKSLFTQGLRITVIRDNSPASKAGLRKGDIIVGAADWETLSDSDLWYAIGHPQEPSKVTLRYLRYSEPMTAVITLEGLADAAKLKSSELPQSPTEGAPNPGVGGSKELAKPTEQPMRQVVMLQEQVNRAMDELADGAGTIDKAIQLVKELYEAETLGQKPNARNSLEHLARWQKLKQIAVDAAKRGSLPAAKLKEVEKTLQEAIQQAGYQSHEAFPRVRMTPRSFRKTKSHADQALRSAQEQIDSLTKSNPGISEQEIRRRFPKEWKELESAQAEQRSIDMQIDGVNLTMRLCKLRLEQLRAESREVGKAGSSEHAKRIVEAQQNVKRIEHVAELYRQAMAPPEKRTLPVVVDGTDVENEGAVEERLWNYVGVELRQQGAGSGVGIDSQPTGLMVTGVRNGSPAQKAGIQFRDFVRAVDGFGTDSAADVWDVFVETAPPREVTFHILRDNRDNNLLHIKVDLTNADNAVDQPKTAKPPATATPGSLVPSSGDSKPSGDAPLKIAPKIDRPAKVATPKTGPSAA